MNLWLAILIAVIVGWAFGKQVVMKSGKKFSWLAFFVTVFLLLGGFYFILTGSATTTSSFFFPSRSSRLAHSPFIRSGKCPKDQL